MTDNSTNYGRPVSTLQGDTREAILTFLKENITGTTQDFITASGDNDNNVRRALRFLDSKKIIKTVNRRFTGSVGNPAKIWVLNSHVE